MLALLREHSNEIERTLRRVYNVRLSDRWRFDENGQRLLTLREIWVLLRELPDDAPLVMALGDGTPRWSRHDYLLADLFQAWTGKPHYARPVTKQPVRAPDDPAVLATQKRFAERNRELAKRQ